MPRLVLRSSLVIASLALVAAFVGAQSPTPSALDRLTARTVIDLVEHHHMARPNINDETAKKWGENFIKDLDPQKCYFLKSDVAEFRKHFLELDDEIKKGDLTFCKLVFDRFLTRSDERWAQIQEILKSKQDFNVDEKWYNDADTIDFPADAKEAGERWRLRLKAELLESKLNKVDDAEAVAKLVVRYHDRNRFVHQMDSGEMLEIYLSSLTRTFDPHSSYMGAKNFEDLLQQSLHLKIDGIGATLQTEDGVAIVREIVPGMAADKDGRLQPEDKIVGIQNPDGTETSLVEKKINDVVRYIRGKRGTKVRLIVIPAGEKERKIYELTRDKVELKDQHAKGQIIEAKAADSNAKPYKVGVINMPSFYGDTEALQRGDENAVSATKDCAALLKGFEKDHVNAVVVDLRGDGGGLLTEAISMSGLFIDRGPVVQVKDRSGVRHLDDRMDGAVWDGPLVVLIDRSSASASEIFAGVIRDYGRGLIIGDVSTFGKGTVQSVVEINDQLNRLDAFRLGEKELPNLGALKLTIQQFYRVNGESTQVRGVAPHIHIPSLHDQDDFGEGKMDNALKFDKVDALPHDQYNRVPSDLVDQLSARSAERRKANPKFQKQDVVIKKAIERRNRHWIPLKQDKFIAEFDIDEDARKLAEEKKALAKKKKYAEHAAWESDFYNDEIMAIVADYLTLGRKALAGEPVRVGAN